MIRSPFGYGPARGADGDGGAADLQTDVMRFMAILSLCLVAIFALVQSLPQAAPLPVPPVPAAAEPAPAAPAAQPTVERPPAPAAAPGPVASALPEPDPRRLHPEAPRRPAPARADPPPPLAATESPAPPAADPPAQVGFTLSFESDLALSRLVARQEIGLYAIVAGGKALRMSSERGKLSFWDASTPAEYHEMDASTVPAEVIAALRRSGAPAGARVVWGVTLPARMSRDLDRYLRQFPGGALVIGADGSLRREG